MSLDIDVVSGPDTHVTLEADQYQDIYGLTPLGMGWRTRRLSGPRKATISSPSASSQRQEWLGPTTTWSRPTRSVVPRMLAGSLSTCWPDRATSRAGRWSRDRASSRFGISRLPIAEERLTA